MKMLLVPNSKLLVVPSEKFEFPHQNFNVLPIKDICIFETLTF